jgi:hypothetical protein
MGQQLIVSLSCLQRLRVLPDRLVDDVDEPGVLTQHDPSPTECTPSMAVAAVVGETISLEMVPVNEVIASCTKSPLLQTTSPPALLPEWLLKLQMVEEQSEETTVSSSS